MFLGLFFIGLSLIHWTVNPRVLGLSHPNKDSLAILDSLRKVVAPDSLKQLPPAPSIVAPLTEIDRQTSPARICVNDYDLKQLVKACDYQNETVRSYAIQLAGETPGELNLGQICNIFDHLYGNWSYVNDPNDGNNYVEKASNIITYNFKGDCDDYAVVMAAMLTAIGANVRITYADGYYSGHAFAEVNLGLINDEEATLYLQARYADYKEINGRIDKGGNFWLNLDWNCAFPGGPYFQYYKGHVFHIVPQFCYHFTRSTS